MQSFTRLSVAVIGVLALLGPATTSAQSVVARDLAAHDRTYAWAPAVPQATGDPRLDNNRFFEERVKAAVERQLNARGYMKTDTAPGLLVRYSFSVAQQVNPDGLDRPYTTCDDGCEPFVFDVGNLTVDLVDARTRELVWRGWEERTLEGIVGNQTLLEKRVDDAVARIFKRMPATLGRPAMPVVPPTGHDGHGDAQQPAQEMEPESMCSPNN